MVAIATKAKKEEAPKTPKELLTEDLLAIHDAMTPAIAIATKVHACEFRKASKLPYLVHCFEVLKQVSDWGLTDLALWQACLLHDVIETNPTITKDKLVKGGVLSEAADIVVEMTFVPDPKSPLTPQVQKELYIASFATKSDKALMGKCADRACNTRDFLNSDQSYAGKYWRKGTPLWDAALTRFHNNEQFEKVFGPGVLPNMKYTRDMVNRMVVR